MQTPVAASESFTPPPLRKRPSASPSPLASRSAAPAAPAHSSQSPIEFAAPPPPPPPPSTEDKDRSSLFGVELSTLELDPAEQVPFIVSHSLQFLNRIFVPKDNIFEECRKGSKVKALMEEFENYKGGISPITDSSKPKDVATLLYYFLKNLPKTLFPPEFYFALIKAAITPSPLHRFKTIRALVYCLPDVNRKIFIMISTFLRRSCIPVQSLVQRFAHVFLSPPSKSPRHSKERDACVILIEQAPFIEKSETEPILPPNSPPPSSRDYYVEVKTKAEYSSADTRILSFSKDDILQLLDVCEGDGWVIARNSAGAEGLAPLTYIELIPVHPKDAPQDMVPNFPSSMESATESVRLSATNKTHSISITDAKKNRKSQHFPVATERPTKTKSTRKASYIEEPLPPPEADFDEPPPEDFSPPPIPKKTGDPSEASQIESMIKKRKNIADEILETEQSYVSQLTMLYEHFYMKLKENSCGLEPDQVTQMFSNIDFIIQYHKQAMLPQLDKILLTWNDNSCLGPMMLEALPKLKLYFHYINNHGKAVEIYKESKKKKPKFKQFVDTLDYSQAINGLCFESLLILPVQRLPRYVLLLADLLKSTPHNHPDFTPLGDALQSIRDLVTKVDQKKQEMNNEELLRSTVEKIVDAGEDLTISQRKRLFLKDGPVLVAKDERHLFLFNDILIITKPPHGGKYSLKRKIILEAASIEYVDNKIFNLLDGTETFKLTFSTPAEAMEWKNSISTQINTIEISLPSLDTDSKAVREAQEKEFTKKREEIFLAMVKMDEEYLETLKYINEKFLKPILSSSQTAMPMVSGPFARLIMSNFEAVISIQTNFTEELVKRKKEWNTKPYISDIFKVQPLRVYSTYSSLHMQQLSALSSSTQNQLFGTWLFTLEAKEKKNLKDLLHLPTTHVSSYLSYVMELAKCTLKDKGTDHEAIVKIAQELKNLSVDILKYTSAPAQTQQAKK
eukprot:TRINITY_DN6995_c0_g1_i1.p1 TRINITY_DN6995_c0_g1~~TRINITY_DN6995_c0_g1_i1.p1  ORF type:complete len:1108 (+),score=333.15 TRINITY_DN6995_c0_g1_i1:431-3325(+)